MRIAWRQGIEIAGLLPPSSPAAGLLRGDEALHGAGSFFFTTAIDALPAPRTIAPDVLAALETYHRELGAPPACHESLRLLRAGASAVVTGQQAGLLGGPLFTLLKTLTAIRAARDLARRHGRPFVPVFWSETEDHDADEVNQAWVLDASGDPRRFSLALDDGLRGTPVGALPLGEEARRLVAEFFEAAPRTEFTAAAAEELLEDLERSESWGGWFARRLLRLFGGHGLVVADSLDARLAGCARMLWARLLEEPLALTEICRDRARWLAEHGWQPVLRKLARRAPFFLLEEGRRTAVSYERGLFRTPGADYTLLALLQRLDERPGDFSAAVHLRPHLQDFLLPTAVYVAGPTELAYFIQVLPGYRALGVPPPAVCLRASATIVEPAVARVLERHGVEPDRLRRGTDQVLTALLRREQRFAAPALWERTRTQALRPVERLAEELAGEHPELADRAATARGKIEFLLKELEQRTLAGLRKRSDTTREQLERARKRLFPDGRPQERVVASAALLAKFGPGLLDALLEDLPGDFTRHHYGTIIPGGEP